MAGTNLVEELNKMMEDNRSLEIEMKDWGRHSIYKLPTSITDLNQKAYIPQAVSFGPYHHGKPHLLPMEKHKGRAVIQFLERSHIALELLFVSVREVLDDLKSSYAILPAAEWQDDNQFILLMILDGCFMLQILHSYKQTLENNAYIDPIFTRHWIIHMIPQIRRDMLMLENQLPMMVLERLLACKAGQKDDEHLNKLIMKLFSPNTMVAPALGKCLHVLDVYRKSLLQGPPYEVVGIERSGFAVSIPTATELSDAGVRFKRNRNENLEDIWFGRGTLKVPPIMVDDDTEMMFLNLIAFEQQHVEAGNQIASYIFLMSNLIDNEKDVVLLESSHIIENAFGSEKAVAQLFKSLAKDITLDPYSNPNVVLLLYNVREYSEKPWNKRKAHLNRTYFRNPWALISLIASVVLFVLSTVQTVYTVYPHYKNDSAPPTPAVPPPPPPLSRRYGSSGHP